MLLEFASSFISIKEFQSIDIPRFTLITGHNGSGKTHLLRAISGGQIRNDRCPVAPNSPNAAVRYVDCSALVPSDGGFFASETHKNELSNFAQQFKSILDQQNILEPSRRLLRSFKLHEAKYLNSPAEILRVAKDQIQSLFLTEVDPLDVISQMRASFETAKESLRPHFMPFPFEGLEQLALHQGVPLACLTEDQIRASNIATWTQNDIFSHSFNREFVAYRDLVIENDLRQLRAEKRGTSESFLSEKQFEATYGKAPWDLVNQTLMTSRLDFKINAPDLSRLSPYKPELTKISSGAAVQFSDLSSGEKILISLAFCMFQGAAERRRVSPPQVLLLDEIDSPLHPSMSKNLLDAIEKSLVQSFGIQIIATTHSPTTVALAPEDAIHIMDSNQGLLKKISKAEALNILTGDVPTLALSFEGRRQVFVESPADAKNYDALYQIKKKHLAHDRSLQFIPTGTGSANSGCDIVTQIVSDLVQAGNQSVFGLLDWDKKDRENNRIVVLGKETRDGLENVIFDPLLLAGTIARDFANHNVEIGLDPDYRLTNLYHAKKVEIQASVDAVIAKVLGRPSNKDLNSSYDGGLTIDVDKQYLFMDDHELEGKVLEVFPFLGSLSRGKAGVLMLHIINKVLYEAPGFMPMEICNAFNELLSRPAHL